ncbi:MAG TPA: hypothetical protein EYP78_00605 [Candidatus Omnitrophica bacterium]|nr:hypothetical protein [Candidatus Omnitrophota bacterium]
MSTGILPIIIFGLIGVVILVLIIMVIAGPILQGGTFLYHLFKRQKPSIPQKDFNLNQGKDRSTAVREE